MRLGIIPRRFGVDCQVSCVLPNDVVGCDEVATEASIVLPTNFFVSHAISANIAQVLVLNSQINVVAALASLGYFCSSASSAAAVQSIVSSGDILLSGARRASVYPMFSMSKRY